MSMRILYLTWGGRSEEEGSGRRKTIPAQNCRSSSSSNARSTSCPSVATPSSLFSEKHYKRPPHRLVTWKTLKSIIFWHISWTWLLHTHVTFVSWDKRLMVLLKSWYTSSHVAGAPSFPGVSGLGMERNWAMREAVQEVFLSCRFTTTATSGRFNKSCNTWDLAVL